MLDAIHTATVPLSLADVARRLSRNKLDRATIFRNLAALTRTGLVRRIDPGDRIWRFVLEDDTRLRLSHRWARDATCTPVAGACLDRSARVESKHGEGEARGATYPGP
ncbi:MAG: helix-turn-helix domain-containing protein [Deltaproteobacteria bacterium]|nr:helix-turn-helix domain-containing protein [Nannocystaceae bacterium]